MPTVDLPRRQLLLKQEPPSRVRHRRTRTICHDCFPVVTRHMRRRGFLEAWIESLGRLLSEESQRNSRPTLTHEKTQGPQQKNTQRHNRETAQGFQEMHPAPRHTHREFYIPARSGPHSTRSHKPGLHRPLHQQISSQSSRRVLPLVQCRRATNTTTQPHTPNCKDSHHRRAWCSGTPPPRQRHPPTTHRPPRAKYKSSSNVVRGRQDLVRPCLEWEGNCKQPWQALQFLLAPHTLSCSLKRLQGSCWIFSCGVTGSRQKNPNRLLTVRP